MTAQLKAPSREDAATGDGVKESVKILTPIFLVFLATHALLIGNALFTHVDAVPEVVNRLSGEDSAGMASLGVCGMILLLMRRECLTVPRLRPATSHHA